MLRLLLLPILFFSFSLSAQTLCSYVEITPSRPDNPQAAPAGPYCPGELVEFNIDLEFYVGGAGSITLCQWLQGIIPSFGVGWDLDNYTIDEEAPGSEWFWLETGEVNLNVSTSSFGIQTNSDGEDELYVGGSLGAGSALPRGWWTTTEGGAPCTNDGNPNTMWGLQSACGVTVSINFDIELYVKQDYDPMYCGNDEYLKLDIFVMSDGMTGCWQNTACSDDEPTEYRAEILCVGGGQPDLEVEYSTPLCTDMTTDIGLSSQNGYDIIVEVSEESSNDIIGANNYEFSGSGSIQDLLINTGSSTETVLYQAYSYDPSNGCSGPLLDIEIEVYAEIDLEEYDDIVVCPTAPYTFTPNVIGGEGNYSYQWSDGSDYEFIILPLETDGFGQHSVELNIEDEDGCENNFIIRYFNVEDFQARITGESLLLQDGIQDNYVLNLTHNLGNSGSYDIDWFTTPPGLSYNILNGNESIAINEEASPLGTYMITALIEDENECRQEATFIVTVSDSVPNCTLNDSLNLLALYDDWNGAAWPLTNTSYEDSIEVLDIPNYGNRWSTGRPINEWHGVTTSDQGCVTHLILNNQNIQDTLPGVILNLSQLEVLVLDSNMISGFVIDSFERLNKLRLLSLSNNNLEGSLPISLQYADSLRFARFDHNEMSGTIPQEWSIPDSLRSIELPHNNLGGCYPQFIIDLLHFDASANPLLPWQGDHLPFENNQNQIGATCNDGDSNTIQDVIQGDCQCKGQLLSTIDADGDSYFADTDCDDNNPAINPGAVDIPDNGIDEDCDGQDATSIVDADGDGYTSDVDCNDNDSSINPGAAEVCNGIDENCNGQIDEGLTVVVYYQDNDGDGYGNSTLSLTDCRQPSGYAAADGDCDDTNAAINPGAMESCNGTDENCNGQIDEGLPVTLYYQDNDGDGYGNSALSLTDCRQPTGYVAASDDCDDNNAGINPGATEIADNGIDENCDGVDATSIVDADGDGYLSDVDCNDNDATINPGSTEVCNGIDENCNGQIDEGLTVVRYYEDADGDGYGNQAVSVVDCRQPSNFVTNSNDCDDNNSAINPDAVEVPGNGIDENCDGSDAPGLTDADGDGFLSDVDCNDNNANIFPGAVELCDAIDNNCDGQTDEGLTIATYFLDADGDGFGDINSFISDCIQPAGYVIPSDDCNDMNPNINPSAVDIPDNGIDEDCNGVDATSYVDTDGDGITNETDCDDNDATVYPGAVELCDEKDNNCDGSVDEGLTFINYYADADGDGYGDPFTLEQSCEMTLGGFVVNADDCDDTNPDINPAAEEIANNGIDEDCDGMDLLSTIHELDGAELKIYPNPAQSYVRIDFDSNSNYIVNLYNLAGQILSSEDQVSQIELTDIESGIYILEVLIPSTNQRVIEKLVVWK